MTLALAELDSIPGWLGSAAVGAVIAALTYVAKEAYQAWGQRQERLAAKRARLSELSSLLRAARAVYMAQNDQARRLVRDLERRLGRALEDGDGLEAALHAGYDEMNEDERELHAVIRSTTEHGMRRMNEALLEWVAADTDYRTYRGESELRTNFAQALHDLETHLLIWRAKFAAWIPDNPGHALVYLADESQHGPEFPHQIDGLVDRLARV